jgi:acyl carrier protein phosphodiesterase
MNYVAHLFLAKPTDEHRIGSILADFTNGPIDLMQSKFGIQIADGIRHHREIDRYTDNHPAVKQSVSILNDDFGIYAGIVVDVVYDHYLINHWNLYSSQNMNNFFDDIYTSLCHIDENFPQKYKEVITRMLKLKWLKTYKDLDQVAYALSKVSLRFSRKTPMGNALPALKRFYTVLENDFLIFFPDLIKFSNSIR